MWARLLLFVPLAVAAASCATLSEGECQVADWEMLGVEDGQNGETAARFNRYVEDCGRHGIKPDAAAWRTGQKRGLETFCTPAGVYWAGLARRGSPSACGSREELFRIHRAASNLTGAEQLLRSAENRIDQLLNEMLRRERNTRRTERRLIEEDDLSNEERVELRREVRRRRDRADELRWELRRARIELIARQRDLLWAQRELFEIEQEFGLGSDRRRQNPSVRVL